MNIFKWFKSAKNISAVADGKTFNVNPSHPAYPQLEVAAREGNGEEFVRLVDVPTAVSDYSQGSIHISGGRVFYGTHEIKNSLTDRILDAMARGIPFTPFVSFLDNLIKNPSRRAVNELYSWLENNDIPITVDGCWLGYKAVKSDWMDKHSGTVSNRIGEHPTMPRSLVDDNWGVDCSQGFHVGSTKYVGRFGGDGDHYIVVKVNPRDVVSVPEASVDKCRCDNYEVIAEWDKNPLTWPVYDAAGPGSPIRPVDGIVRDLPKPQVTPKPVVDDNHPAPNDTNFKYQVDVTLTIHESDGIIKELEKAAYFSGGLLLETITKTSYAVVVFNEFDSRDDAEEFCSEIKNISYVADTRIVTLDEDDNVVHAEKTGVTEIVPSDPDGLHHLSTRQRYELRLRAIDMLLAKEPNKQRYAAEVQVEAMTRRQMAESLPSYEQQQYLDPNIQPDVNVLFPISFDIFDGGIKVGSHNVRTEDEETQIMAMAKLIYPFCEQQNRIVH